jgi:hypothetical protein
MHDLSFWSYPIGIVILIGENSESIANKSLLGVKDLILSLGSDLNTKYTSLPLKNT